MMNRKKECIKSLKVSRLLFYYVMILVTLITSLITVFLFDFEIFPSVPLFGIFCIVIIAKLFDDPFYIHYSSEGVTLQYYRRKREIKWFQINKLGYESTGFGFSQFVIHLSDGKKIMFEGKIENNAKEVIEAFKKYGKSERRT